MICVLFPAYSKDIRYYDVHYRFLLNIFYALGFQVKFFQAPELNENSFLIYIKGLLPVPILVDFSDHLTVSKWLDKYPICFKYHYSNEHHSGYKGMYPIGPISFHDWDAYSLQRNKSRYQLKNNMILNNQRPYADAIKRRRRVQRMLKRTYGTSVDTRFYSDKNHFWNLISECLVSVCVPGARNDMLDRGQFQAMAFGCCTISPKLNTVLAGGVDLRPGAHYITCESNYSNLIERIEWCLNNRHDCIDIGSNAAMLFEQTSTPTAIWNWMKECLNK